MHNLLKKIRLSGKRQFDAVFSGRKIVSTELVFYFAPNDIGSQRLGIVAGKKVIPGSVDRNRFKRMVRELFRMHQSELKGHDLVVLPRKGGRLDSFQALKCSFDKLVNGFESFASR